MHKQWHTHYTLTLYKNLKKCKQLKNHQKTNILISINPLEQGLRQEREVYLCMYMYIYNIYLLGR